MLCVATFLKSGEYHMIYKCRSCDYLMFFFSDMCSSVRFDPSNLTATLIHLPYNSLLKLVCKT